jgi:hypothetical protein
MMGWKLTIQTMRRSSERPSSVKLLSVDLGNAAVLQQLTSVWVRLQSIPDVHVGSQWLRKILHRVLQISPGLWSRLIDTVSYPKGVRIPEVERSGAVLNLV